MCAFAPWQGADHCTGAATPGAKALMKFLVGAVPHAANMGIYNCRNVRGGSTTSCHGEGRADDVGMPMVGGKGSPQGHALVQVLRPIASELGIQCIIYDRTIWSAKSPGKNGRPYTGADPHYTHIHIELTRAAGQKINLATVKHVLAGPIGGLLGKPTPATIPTVSLAAAQAEARTGTFTGPVAAALKAKGLPPTRDGYAELQRHEHYSGHDADGIPGVSTFTRLGAETGLFKARTP